MIPDFAAGCVNQYLQDSDSGPKIPMPRYLAKIFNKRSLWLPWKSKAQQRGMPWLTRFLSRS
jgi:hypothetical protein